MEKECNEIKQSYARTIQQSISKGAKTHEKWQQTKK